MLEPDLEGRKEMVFAEESVSLIWEMTVKDFKGPN